MEHEWLSSDGRTIKVGDALQRHDIGYNTATYTVVEIKGNCAFILKEGANRPQRWWMNSPPYEYWAIVKRAGAKETDWMDIWEGRS